MCQLQTYFFLQSGPEIVYKNTGYASLQVQGHFDQVDFMSFREARHRMIWALNIIHSTLSRTSPGLLMSATLEKAPNKVDCLFMHCMLEALGPTINAWIGSLYPSPLAQIQANGLLLPLLLLEMETERWPPVTADFLF